MFEPIKPMLASPPKGERLATLGGTYVFDLKLDGIRAIAYWDGGTLRLINRSMKDITFRFPELEMTAPQLDGPCILDGEIVASDGSFQTLQGRDKLTKPADIARGVQTSPVTFVAFDLLYGFDVDYRSHPFETRRSLLESACDWGGLWTTSVISADPGFFEQVKEKGLEGVIAKRKRSTYRSGRFSDWIKFKAVRSITAIGVGYEPGEGARSHFGAMYLALIGPDGKPVPIGKVGTGFTASQITSLKERMDAGVPVLVEIECLNVTKDGSLRFPVYKGERGSELSLADARLDQLEDIPRC